MRRLPWLTPLLLVVACSRQTPDPRGDASTGLDADSMAMGCGEARVAPGFTCAQLGAPLEAPRDLWRAEDGTLYVTESGAGRVVRLEGERWVTVADGLAGPIGLRQGPDGRLVVAQEGDASVSFLDPDTGELSLLAGDLRAVTYLTLDAAGDNVYVSSFGQVAPVGSGTILRIPLDTGRPVPHATELHVPEGLYVEADGSLVVAEWHLPSAIYRFRPGGSPRDEADQLASGFDEVYGLYPDGDGGFFVGDHAGRVVHIRPDGTRDTLLDGIGKPGGIMRDGDGALLIAEFVDFRTTGRVLRLARE